MTTVATGSNTVEVSITGIIIRVAVVVGYVADVVVYAVVVVVVVVVAVAAAAVCCCPSCCCCCWVNRNGSHAEPTRIPDQHR